MRFEVGTGVWVDFSVIVLYLFVCFYNIFLLNVTMSVSHLLLLSMSSLLYYCCCSCCCCYFDNNNIALIVYVSVLFSFASISAFSLVVVLPHNNK